MLNFLVHKRKINIVTNKKPQLFCNHFFVSLINELENSYISEIEIQENELSFTAPPGRFAWNGWNLFNPISAGKIRINLQEKTPKLVYELEFNEFLFIAIAMSFSSASAFFSGSLMFGFIVLAITWLGFYLGSRQIATGRFYSFIDDTIFKINYPDKERLNYMKYIKEDIDFIKQVFFERKNTGTG